MERLFCPSDWKKLDEEDLGGSNAIPLDIPGAGGGTRTSASAAAIFRNSRAITRLPTQVLLTPMGMLM
jgi:hypothetical protein